MGRQYVLRIKRRTVPSGQCLGAWQQCYRYMPDATPRSRGCAGGCAQVVGKCETPHNKRPSSSGAIERSRLSGGLSAIFDALKYHAISAIWRSQLRGNVRADLRCSSAFRRGASNPASSAAAFVRNLRRLSRVGCSAGPPSCAAAGAIGCSDDHLAGSQWRMTIRDKGISMGMQRIHSSSPLQGDKQSPFAPRSRVCLRRAGQQIGEVAAGGAPGSASGMPSSSPRRCAPGDAAGKTGMTTRARRATRRDARAESI